MSDRYFDIDKRTALVTGAASGIGLAVVKRLLKAGVKVVAADINSSDELVSAGVQQLRCDISDANDVQSVFERAVESMGKLDIVINNAGIGPETGRLDQTDLPPAIKTLEVNLVGVLHCLKFAPQNMNDGGSIINTASAAAGKGFPTYGPYAASKAGVLGLTRVAAVELGPRGIRVNAICPGTIATPMEPSDSAESRVSKIVAPMGRVGTTEDVVGLFHFLATEESRYITGQAIYVDGGVSAGFPDTMIDKLCV